MRHKDSFVPPVRNTALISMVAWGLVPEQMDSATFQRIRRDVKRDLRAYAMKLEPSSATGYQAHDWWILKARVGRKGSNYKHIGYGPLQVICRCALTRIEAKHPLPTEVTP